MTDTQLFGTGMAKLLFPKSHAVLNFDADGPLFFLAGPVRGGGNWQDEAARMIARRFIEEDEPCQIAIPYYHMADRPFRLMEHRHFFGTKDEFSRQRDWEEGRIMQSMSHGCLIFWLPPESRTDPRPPGTGPYARDTYGELGRYSARRGSNPCLNMVVGGVTDLSNPDGFPGFDLIRRNQFHDWKLAGLVNGHEDDYQLPCTLEGTVEAAIDLARRVV